MPPNQRSDHRLVVATAVFALSQQAAKARPLLLIIDDLPWLDRSSALVHGREGGAITAAIEALFLLGQDAFHTGRWKEARELADEGLQLCAVHDLARIRLAYGSALRRVKRTTDARQQLAGAAELFHRLGAAPWAAQAASCAPGRRK